MRSKNFYYHLICFCKLNMKFTYSIHHKVISTIFYVRVFVVYPLHGGLCPNRVVSKQVSKSFFYSS